MLPREHYLKQAFQDSTHFPDGFEKGGLSDIQARLIRKNGTLINALSIDEVSDPTTEDLHLLKVIANQSSPKNPVEQAWVKYLSLVKSLSITNPKAKGKAKANKAATPVAEPEEKVAVQPVNPAEKAELPKVANKIPAKKEAVPAEVKTKAIPPVKAPVAVPVKNEKAATVAKAPAKVDTKKPEPKKAQPVKVEPKKPEPKKIETKKAEPKKEALKKEAPKKAEVKKPEPKKVPAKTEPKKLEAKKIEAKKVETKKVEPKKPEPKKVAPKKVEAKKVETKKAAAKAEVKKVPAKKSNTKK